MISKKTDIGRLRSAWTGRAAGFVQVPRSVWRSLSWIALVLVLSIATARFGWWTIPIVAAVWGAFHPGRAGWWLAGLAAALSWGSLLSLTAIRGPIGELSQRVGDMLGLPGFVLVLLTLAFPTLLAGSSAELADVLRQRARRKGHG